MVPSPFTSGRVKDEFRYKFKRPLSDQEAFVLFSRAPRYEDACTQVDWWHRLEVAAKQRAAFLAPLIRSFGASSGRRWLGLSARVTVPNWAGFDVAAYPWCWLVLAEVHVVGELPNGLGSYVSRLDVGAHEISANPCTQIDAVLPRWTLRGVAEEIARREGKPLTDEESAILDLCVLDPL